MVRFGKMSRIGKQPITIPEGVKVEIEPDRIKVGGPKGELELRLPDGIEVSRVESEIRVIPRRHDKKTRANHGTVRNLISNMIIGVTRGWEKELEVVGTGYRVSLEGDKLVFKLGFSHPVVFQAPEGIRFEAQENKFKVIGIDKVRVGNLAAKIRKVRPPDAYKGKGIRYVGEKIKLKPGKVAGTAGGGQ